MDKEKSIISVFGEGKIKIPPDFIKIFIRVSKTTSTIKESQNEVNKSINILINIFKKYNIEDIQTTSISIHQKYDWKSDERKFLGHEVEQDIIAKIFQIEKNIENVKNVLDEFTITDSEMYVKINFGIIEYDKRVIETRDLAIKNAFEKATRYANKTGLKIIKPIKIKENLPGDDRVKHFWYSQVKNEDDNDFLFQLPIGIMEMGVKIFCEYLAE